MKKLLLLALTIGLSISGCSSDDQSDKVEFKGPFTIALEDEPENFSGYESELQIIEGGAGAEQPHIFSKQFQNVPAMTKFELKMQGIADDVQVNIGLWDNNHTNVEVVPSIIYTINLKMVEDGDSLLFSITEKGITKYEVWRTNAQGVRKKIKSGKPSLYQ